MQIRIECVQIRSRLSHKLQQCLQAFVVHMFWQVVGQGFKSDVLMTFARTRLYYDIQSRLM